MTAYKVKKALPKSKGFPVKKKGFSEANAEADVAEKKKYPKGYAKLKKIDKRLPKGEILGHIAKTGKISVSKKVPKKLREEVVFHEKMEGKKLRKKK